MLGVHAQEFLLVFKDLFIYLFIYLLLERREGREGNIDMKENIDQLPLKCALTMCPDKGPNPQPRHVPCPRSN